MDISSSESESTEATTTSSSSEDEAVKVPFKPPQKKKKKIKKKEEKPSADSVREIKPAEKPSHKTPSPAKIANTLKYDGAARGRIKVGSKTFTKKQLLAAVNRSLNDTPVIIVPCILDANTMELDGTFCNNEGVMMNL